MAVICICNDKRQSLLSSVLRHLLRPAGKRTSKRQVYLEDSAASLFLLAISEALTTRENKELFLKIEVFMLEMKLNST